MAHELVAMMGILGYETFMVAGHDRGGRVAYRMALDHPNTVSCLVVLDIVPIEAAWQFADDRLVMSYWPWSLLAQPEPLPERLLGAAPDAVIHNAAAQWGSLPAIFPEDVANVYTAMLASPVHVHAICEEYRAAAGVDREHDLQDLETGQSISCPTLVVWSRDGPLDKWYDREGGAVGLWRPWARNVEGRAISGGHFFPEEYPVETAGILSEFFKRIMP